MEYKHNPPTLAELRHSRAHLMPANRNVKMRLSSLEHFALLTTRAVGTMGFFFLLCFWTIAWLLWNTVGPVEYRFDPAPAFVIWLFASNIIQLVLLPMVMVGQNIESKFSEHRAQADFEINQKAEQEIEIIIAHLENQNELLLELARKIDKR